MTVQDVADGACLQILGQDVHDDVRTEVKPLVHAKRTAAVVLV